MIDDIKNSIKSLTGVSSANTDFIESAQRFVVQSSPKNLLRFAMTASSASTNGNAISHDRNDSIIDVQRNGYSCREIPFSESAWATDNNSLKKASALYPVWWSQSDGVKIAPATASSAGAGYVFFIDYAKIDDDTDLRNAVVLHASSSEFTKLATGTVGSWDAISLPVSPSSPNFGNDLTISFNAPTSPSNPSFTYVDASVSDITKPIISISNKASLSANAPSYSKPVFASPSLGTVGSLNLPSAPITPSLSTTTVSFGQAAPSYTKPVLSLTSAPIIVDLDISAQEPVSIESPSFDAGAITVGNAQPSYTKTVFSAPSLESINPMSIRSAPIAPISPSFAYGDASASDILSPITTVSDMASLSASAPNYISPVVTLTTFPTLTWNLPEKPIAPTIQSQAVGDFTSEAPSYIAPVLSLEDAPNIVSLSITAIPPQTPTLSSSTVGTIASIPTFKEPIINALDYTDTEKWITTEEDSEMLQARVSVMNSKVQEFQAMLGKSIGVFNKDNSIYQTNLQVAVEDAKLSSQDDSQLIQKFSNDVNKYQADVSKEVQEFQQNFQKELQLWQTGRQTSIQKHSSDIQSALNDFNEEQALFQATVQKKLKNADLLNSHEVNKLQKFQHELGAFQSSTTKVVSSNQAECSCWQQESSILIQKYASQLQDGVNSFNKENIAYQEDVQRKIQNLNKDLSIAVENSKNEIAANSANMNKSVQISMQNSVQNAKVKVEEYNAKLGKYNSEIQSYQAEVNLDLQKWKAEEWDKKFQKYTLDYNSQLKEYTSNIQNELNVFNKEQSSYQLVLQEKMEEAKNQQTKDASEYGAKIQKYSAEVQSYQAEVNKEVQEYTVNEIQKEIGIWSQNIQSDLQQYSSDIQNELNIFQKENAEYQAQLNVSIKNADLSDAADSKKIQQYQSEIQTYQAEVASNIQKWTAEEWTQSFQKYQIDYTSLLQTYQNDIQNELNEFNKENIAYQEDIGRKTEDFQKEVQQALKNADSDLQSKSANLQKDTQLALQNAMNGYREDVDEYASSLQKYSAEIQNYQQNVNKEVQNYVNSLNKKVQEYQSEIALYSAEVQKYQIDISEQTQEGTLKTQNVAYYSKESDRCYQMAVAEVQRYISNNEKMIQQTMAAQAAQG
tara:strand:+ start:6832 stop:10218 length:3387 start_codon:yes stop_codon:yes gene_type:complete